MAQQRHGIISVVEPTKGRAFFGRPYFMPRSLKTLVSPLLIARRSSGDTAPTRLSVHPAMLRAWRSGLSRRGFGCADLRVAGVEDGVESNAGNTQVSTPEPAPTQPTAP